MVCMSAWNARGWTGRLNRGISCLFYLDLRTGIYGWGTIEHDMGLLGRRYVTLGLFSSPLQRLSSDSTTGSLPANSLLLDCVVLLLAYKIIGCCISGDLDFCSNCFSNSAS
jgi:hypothetical protein